MKKQTLINGFLFVLFGLLQVTLFAQDGQVTTTSEGETTTTTWYAAPWVWIVAGAVVLILLLSLFRRSGSSDSREKEVHRTTVIKDR